MTLDDLEWPFPTLFQNTCVFEAHHENLNEDKPILSAAMTLVSGNIRFMRTFDSLETRRQTIVG